MDPNQQRITRLVNEQIGFVARVLRNLGVPAADLDDAVQRTFILASTKMDEIREGSERGFLFQTAKHMAAHAWRSRARFKGHQSLDEEMVSPGESPEALSSQKHARELLDSILEAMPEDLRVVFTLYEFEDFSVPEIAEVLHIPTGTAASRLRRARSEFSAHVQRFEARSRYELTKRAIS
jgi:RNA polymerase sigma-70 factor, ECF subfamily